MVSAHEAKIIAPYYADAGDGTLLHRYLDDQFIARFNQQAAAGTLTGTGAQSWRTSDRFGSSKDKVTLRLPIHRTFYLVACEVCCDRTGNPALDPARIISAGMVVRKGSPQSYRTWQMREGAAIGWRAGRAADVGQEPDHYRRLLKRGLVQPRVPEPPYSGEQTHRLHSLLVKARDAHGNLRHHTLLYGYLPLGGSVEVDLARLPRYTQGRDDMYFVCPFVRYRDCCNKEQIVWGPPSEIFRVASPLDPEAVRPTVIQLAGNR